MRLKLIIMFTLLPTLFSCGDSTSPPAGISKSTASNTTPIDPTAPFSIVILPDTQNYCDVQFAQSTEKWGKDLRSYFFKQTDWIVESKEELNTVFVVHEGDIVQSDFPEEWDIANKAISRLDGHVPYSLSIGNHDMGVVINADGKSYKDAQNRSSNFDQYFPSSRYDQEPWFGGTYDNSMSNAYFKFHPSKQKFLLLSLEHQPRDEVLIWANDISEQNSDYQIIILTHSYLTIKNTRINSKPSIAGNNGQLIWEKLISKQPNIFMVLSGHSYGMGLGYLRSEGIHGNEVHQILTNFQSWNNGGESWLRYMTFYPKQNKIKILTYNPTLEKMLELDTSHFEINYTMTKSENP